MSDRSRQFSHSCNSRSFAELGACLAKVVLSLLLLIDVHCNAIPVDDGFTFISERLRSHQIPVIFAVIGSHSIRIFVRNTQLNGPAPALLHRCHVFRIDPADEIKASKGLQWLGTSFYTPSSL